MTERLTFPNGVREFPEGALLAADPMGEVELPPVLRLIGFGAGPSGAGRVYLVRTDEFDLKWLERYTVVR